MVMATERLGPPWQVPAGEGSGELDCAAFLKERRRKGRKRRRWFFMEGKEAGGASRGGGQVRR